MAADRRAPTRVVLACGGTGGHVYPAIAIAREILAREPAAAVSFVGRASSFESEALAREGFEMDALRVGRLAGQSAARRAATLAGLPLAIARAAAALGRRRPEVVIGTGGFVSGPTMLAAVLRGIPTVSQEQNAQPGFTQRVLWRMVDRVALPLPMPGLGAPRFHVTGNPVRPEFFAVPPLAPSAAFTLLVLGGSQGARSLNEAALEAAERLSDLAGSLRVVLQCGPRWEAAARERARSLAVEVEAHGFLHDVPARLAAASLVACRAGASTVAEICAAGRPALLVPYPHAAGDHQTANARALAASGAAETIADADLTGERLAQRVREALSDRRTLAQLASRARGLARPDAAGALVDLALDACRRSPGPRPALAAGGLA